MKLLNAILLCIMLTAWSCKHEPVSHSFFIAGPQFTGIIDEDGTKVWDSGKPGARDGYVLSNGHVLICWADEVKEYDNDKNVVFSFKPQNDSIELGTAVRLENGNTLITESGKSPRLIEVDNTGVEQVSIPLQPETDNIHMQTRMARKLINGNYLVPHLLAFAVHEYSPNGEIIKSFRTDIPEIGTKDSSNWPFTAIRLENGNTLVSLTHGNKIVEFDADGAVVWKVSNQDLDIPAFQDPCGLQRLPNGNTVIASYGAKDSAKLFEINGNNEIVWSFDDFNVHEFQILTTNGKPLEGKPAK